MTIPELVDRLKALISNAQFEREEQKRLLEEARYFNSTLSDDPPNKWLDQKENESSISNEREI